MRKRWKKKSRGDMVFDTLNTVFLLAVMFICLFPFLNVLALSFSGNMAVMTNQVTLLPVDFTINTYKTVFKNPNIWTSYKNSLLYTSVFICVSMCVTSLAAYPLSKKRLVGRKQLLFFVTFTTIFHGGLIPTYLVVRNVGLLDSMWSLILPYCITVYNVMLLRTSFESVPEELEEAAKIDGLGDFGILTRIYVPLSKPIYATLFLMMAVSQWNSFFPALLYLNKRAQYPLQIVLREIVLLDQQEGFLAVEQLKNMPAELALKSATIIVVTLPILILFPCMKKYFVNGLAAGAVKG